MSLTHDVIKMRFVEEGYLPNYPYHLISDAEMCDAFLKAANKPVEGSMFIADTSCNSFFLDMYPCLYPALNEAYNALIDSILWHINELKASKNSEYILPDWIYSYMLGAVVGPNSDTLDIHDMLVLMGIDNVDDVFSEAASERCKKISTQWVARFPANIRQHRSPTIFGEPHVIKYLRIAEASNTGK